MKSEVILSEVSTRQNGYDHSNKRVPTVKSFITNEIMLFFYGSLFSGFTISLVLNFLQFDALWAIVSGFTMSFFIFLGLVKLNNQFFKVDKMRLKDLVLANDNDSLKPILAFDNEIKLLCSRPDSVNSIQDLFKKIFSEDEMEYHLGILSKSSDVLHFLSILTPINRERLYRYYIVKDS
jgi:hypothetical protein